MRLSASLLAKLRRDHPSIEFSSGDEFHWSPPLRRITYNADDRQADARILHELAHALLDHQHYPRDIALIGLERDAWTYAQHTLAPRYRVTIDETAVEDDLDTYRDWLHARSRCPGCTASGIELASASLYQCLACHSSWQANPALTTALRRRIIKTPSV